ncbi:hypothetical protein [Burkholderia pseudomultivorans]|uniref:hypothetical protein n=1 Tax=Burkholderia pseudomultivorans TaxID=1207504 RepID=UPI000B10B395|nr:hypothetical protein [Burkholderia pseudomultivorans]
MDGLIVFLACRLLLPVKSTGHFSVDANAGHPTVQLLSGARRGRRSEIFSVARAKRPATSKTCAFRPQRKSSHACCDGLFEGVAHGFKRNYSARDD